MINGFLFAEIRAYPSRRAIISFIITPMKAVIQRVSHASVSVGGALLSRIDAGLLILLGIRQGDSAEQFSAMARKIAALRIFTDAEGKMNLSVLDIAGAALVVSQFTLCANTRKGNRPSFVEAEKPERAEGLVNDFADELRRLGVPTQTGKFGASMQVELLNDGPVTIVLES